MDSNSNVAPQTNVELAEWKWLSLSVGSNICALLGLLAELGWMARGESRFVGLMGVGFGMALLLRCVEAVLLHRAIEKMRPSRRGAK